MTELVTNGAFDTDTTGWSESSLADNTSVSGKLRVTNSGAGAAFAYQAITTVVGQSYKVVTELFAGTSPAVSLFVGTTLGGADLVNASGAGSKDKTFTATTTTSYVQLRNGSTSTTGQYNEFDNISVQPLPPRKPARSSSFLA